MESYIKTPQSTIRYRISGSGPAVILLHGYLEDLTIWDELTVELESNHTVLSIDLPGHGKSDCDMEIISMDFMADAVRAVMHYEQIEKTFLLGHSMGGYVSLAFAERYPNTLTGLCLLHSTPNSDSDEKRAARMADIQLVKEGRKEDIVQTNIPRLFATQNLKKFSGEIDHIKNIARSTTDRGIIGALSGMAERPDRNVVLAQAKYPVSMIFGKFDNLIPMDVVQVLQERHKNARTVILNHSGHMSFIEEPDQTVEIIRSIVSKG